MAKKKPRQIEIGVRKSMLSRQKAIWEQCHQCIAADKKSSWVKDVEGCLGYTCCLYHLRPVRGEDGKRVDAYKNPRMVEGWSSDVAHYLAPFLLSLLNDNQRQDSTQDQNEYLGIGRQEKRKKRAVGA